MKADLVVVLGLKTPVSDNSTLPLERVPCIHYPLYFRKDQREIQALIDFGNEINVMTPAYVKRLPEKPISEPRKLMAPV